MCKKTFASVLMRLYDSNENGNHDHIHKKKTNPDVDIELNARNLEKVTVRWGLYVLSNTSGTFDAQFIKKLSKTEAELKRALLIKKSS